MNVDKNRQSLLFDKVTQLLSEARSEVVRSVNKTMVYTYFEIGKLIVEEEQHGKNRAEYGKSVLKTLSYKLAKEIGKGFSVDNLENMRKFYLTYSNSETVSRNLKTYEFKLSWSHYLKLVRINKFEERQFYEIEAIQNNWSLRELRRQFDSALYQRLVLSRDKKEVKKYQTVLPSKEELKLLIEEKR